MTRITPRLLAITLSLCLAACSADADDDSQPSTQEDMGDADANMDSDMSPDMSEDIADMNAMDADLSPGCTSEMCPGGKIDNIPTFLYLDPGSEFTFEPWLIAPDGTRVEDAVFSYETTDPFVGSINASGILRGESEGSVIITVSSGGLSAESRFAISVISASYSSPGSCSGKVGETCQIYLETLDENFEEIEADKICESADESIATVTKYDCLVTFVSPGETTVNLEGRFVGIESDIEITVTE